MTKKLSNHHSKIIYEVQTKDPHLHYFQVILKVKTSLKTITLQLPEWSPGSYVLRDYSSHIHNISLKSSKNGTKLNPIGLSSWEVVNIKDSFQLSYIVYGFEHSVRTNFLDYEYGFINSPGFFFYVVEQSSNPVEVHFFPNSSFPFVYSALKRIGSGNKFIAYSFDELYDSPFQLSKQASYPFSIQKYKHEVLIEGSLSSKLKEKIVSDIKKIVEYEINLYGECPNQYYLFIINLSQEGFGGLEHAACSVNIFSPLKLYKKEEYNRFLSLIAHEYFHLWNVKRIRPIALGPFDYTKPNLTRELWISEGITSFYDNYIILCCNFSTMDEYLEEIFSDIKKLENFSGEDWMSLEESSFTTWNKFYKINSNSHNTGISYYIKGGLLTFCMDIRIRKQTDCSKNFMDVMRLLYSKFYLKLGRGFTKDEFFETAREATGIDLYAEFDRYISNKNRIPIYDYLNELGIVKKTKETYLELGFTTREDGGNLLIQKINHFYSVKDIDLNVDDELIAIDGMRVTSGSNLYAIKEMIQKEEKSKITLLLARKDKIIERELMCDYKSNYKLEVIEEMKQSPLYISFFTATNH